MGYVRFATVVDTRSGAWKLRPLGMTGHALRDMLSRFFPDLRVESSREEIIFDTQAQLDWQDTGKPYVHTIGGDAYYRAGFYVTDEGGLLPDEYYEDRGIATVIQGDNDHEHVQELRAEG